MTVEPETVRDWLAEKDGAEVTLRGAESHARGYVAGGLSHVVRDYYLTKRELAEEIVTRTRRVTIEEVIIAGALELRRELAVERDTLLLVPCASCDQVLPLSAREMPQDFGWTVHPEYPLMQSAYICPLHVSETVEGDEDDHD